MPMDKWPCIPESFSSILPGNLLHVFQSGATHDLGRLVTVVDPKNRESINPGDRFDSYQPFCRCLRGRCPERADATGWDAGCSECDVLVAEHLVKTHPPKDGEFEIVRYRCYMGLEEMATIIGIGGFPVMVVCGQFLPREGPSDILRSIDALGHQPPEPGSVSEALASSMKAIGYPKHLWSAAKISEDRKEHLRSLIAELNPVPTDFEERFREEVSRVQEIAKRYYNLAKDRVENGILSSVAAAFNPSGSGVADLWKNAEAALGALKDGLGVSYAAFLSGRKEQDTILTLKATAGTLQESRSPAVFQHFNWRKAGLTVPDRPRSQQTCFSPEDVTITHVSHLQRGFKPSSRIFPSPSAVVPVTLSSGPYGLLVLGPRFDSANLNGHESFLLSACRDISTRILTLQLAQILTEDRADWERTSKMTGHRVRAAIQSINSQLQTIVDFERHTAGFTATDRDEADRDLKTAFKDLQEISYAAESNVPAAFDVRIIRREMLSISEIVSAAVANQQDLADRDDIEIAVSPAIASLPEVWVNPTLMRYAFINLINNGLKYSYPRADTHKRVLKVKPARFVDPGEVRIEVVNFGLGIKEEDYSRIFEWNVRLVGAKTAFEEIFGKGIGLWETKHIVDGHGGRILVSSVHYTKAPVTDQNIEQCITVFTVVVPAGKDQ